MKVRIPKPVNAALDAAHRNPRVVVAVAAAGAVAWPLALYWASPTAAVITGCVLLLYVVATLAAVRDARLREEIRQLRYDLAAAEQIIKRLSVGDPSAPTAQLRPIGDRGEPT